MLSLEEAIHFVTKILKVSSNLLLQRNENHMEFLAAILKTAQVRLPFQNVTLVATEPRFRCRPSPEEIKRDALAGKGGLCYTINVFMKWLLEALGYDVYCVCGKVGDGVGHLAIIVNNVVKRGDRFIFDAGMGYPTFELTPLDFETETEIYSHSFLKYKFMWEGELVVRCHQRKAKSSDPLDLPGNMDNDWKKVMHIDLTPRELGFFDDLVNVIYTDVECKITPLNNSLRIVGYNEHTFKPVILKDAALLIEGDSSSLKEVKVNSSEEMLKIIEEHYPSLKSDGILALMRLDLFC